MPRSDQRVLNHTGQIDRKQVKLHDLMKTVNNY